MLCIAKNSIKSQAFVYKHSNDQIVLFQTIQFSISTKLDISKYCYVSLIIQLKHQSFVHTVECKNSSILTIQFSISTLSECHTALFDPLIGPYLVLPLRVRDDLGAMTMKEHSPSPKTPALLKPHHQIV